jgi:hypothetical protein
MRFLRSDHAISDLLDEMGELPLPRKERGTAIPNPLKIIGVPS